MAGIARRCDLWFPFLCAAVLIGSGGEAPAAGPRSPASEDRCATCGMAVASHPAWVAEVVLEGGEALFFDGNKCFFRYLLDGRRSDPEHSGRAVVATYVTSYYDQELIPAREAYFVVGSDVRGPMGAELVPLSTAAAAEEFRSDHGGRAILTFDEVSLGTLAELR